MPLSRRHRTLFLWIGGIVCALFGILTCVLVRNTSRPQSIASILKEVGFDQRLGAQVPLDLSFRDEENRDVALRRVFGARPVVLSFVYYSCPMLCTQVLDGLVRSLRAMNLEPGRDFELVTVSIDARDTTDRAAAKKASCIAEYGRPEAAAHWSFLTSPRALAPGETPRALARNESPAALAREETPEIAERSPPSTELRAADERTAAHSSDTASERDRSNVAASTATGESAARLAASVGFRYFYDEHSEQFAHASGIVVLTPSGEVSKYFYGIDYSPRDLRLALVEASSGEIGSWMDQALLLCYHYDPLTGTYGVVIYTAIRAFGILTIVLLGMLILSLLRHERAVRLQAGGS
jgi:protein SCO1/2